MKRVVKLGAPQLRALVNESVKSLTEAGPDAMRIDWSIMDDQIDKAAYDIAMDMSDRLVFDFRKRIIKEIARELDKHAMVYPEASPVDPSELSADLEDFDPNGLQGLSMECIQDITNILVEYAKGLGSLAVHMAGGAEGE